MKKAFWIVVAVLCVSIALNVWQCSSQPEPSVVVERDTVWEDTTIYEPQPTESKETGETIYVKVQTGGDTQGIVPLCQQEPTQQGQSPCVTNGSDSTVIALPVEQKRYDDSLYTAWVSGFRPNLDSIRLYLPTITETITNTIVKPAPRLSVGVQTGAGVGIITRQPDFYIGVGAQWRIWP